MTARITKFTVACLLLLFSRTASAQVTDAFCEPICYSDAQYFAPVDFDFDCRPIRKDCGFFFNYEKVAWSIGGERTPIGSPNAQVLSEDIFPDELALPLNGIVGPPQYPIMNGLQDVAPFAEFGGGDRYELGYYNDNAGWMIGVLDGPDVTTFNDFGIGPQASGFGSLHINFDLSSPGLLLGFRDYGGVVTNGVEVPTATQGGPGVGGNLVIDDLNGNLIAGAVFTFIDVDASGDFNDGDIITGIAYDYGDLYEFNVRFNQVNVTNSTRTRGVELMRFHELSNRHHMAKHQNRQWTIGYGVRFMEIDDSFNFSGTSDLFRGRNFVSTDVENQLVGPQIRAKWSTEKHRFRLGIDTRVMFGYNIQDFDQKGALAEGNTPGGLNQPAILQPNGWSYGKRENDFSPLVELRADLSYQVTGALALKLGYTAMYTDNISRAASVTRWSLPDMGFLEGGQQDVFINGVNGGVEVVY